MPLLLLLYLFVKNEVRNLVEIRDSVVIIKRTLRPGCSWIRIPARVEIIFFSKSHELLGGSHRGTVVHFRTCSEHGVMLTNQLHPAPRVRIGDAVPLFFLYTFMATAVTTLLSVNTQWFSRH